MNFLEGLEEGKEFRTKVAEIRHGDHRGVPKSLSVPSVVEWSNNAEG
jgi:hypothetical protein